MISFSSCDSEFGRQGVGVFGKSCEQHKQIVQQHLSFQLVQRHLRTLLSFLGSTFASSQQQESRPDLACGRQQQALAGSFSQQRSLFVVSTIVDLVVLDEAIRIGVTIALHIHSTAKAQTTIGVTNRDMENFWTILLAQKTSVYRICYRHDANNSNMRIQ